jgi:hypothetical protein
LNPVRRTFWISLPFCLLVISVLPSMAEEKSLAITYGPTQSVQFAFNLKNMGVYLQPIIDYSSDDFRNSFEYGSRIGVQVGYTAFAFRRLECRLIAGAGGHGVTRRLEFLDQGRIREIFEDRQTAAEVWMQPEFRFYETFGVVLQAQLVRYLFETGDRSSDRRTVRFETPDLSLGELRIGLRYYLLRWR